MKRYSDYEEKRARLLEKARKAGISAPAKRWPKLSGAAWYNRGEAEPYWEQLDSLRSAIELAGSK
jgi:hypothetical protein